jgi:hypothetical protein
MTSSRPRLDRGTAKTSLAIAAAVAVALAACTSSSPQSASATVGSANGPAQVLLGPDMASSRDDVRISTGTDPEPNAQGGSDGTATLPSTGVSWISLPLGPVVDIQAPQTLAGALVSMPVDESRLPTTNSHRATTANVFIAVWDDVLKAWVPLDSTYDGATHRISARAPHFSLFQEYVVDPAKSIWDATTTGLSALKKAASATFDALVSGTGSFLKDEWSPDQKEIDGECSSLAPGWSIVDGDQHVTGCIAGTADRSELYLRNAYLFSYDAQLPPGQPLDIGDGYYPDDYDASSVLARWSAYGAGDLLLAGRGRARTALPAALTQPGAKSTVSFSPDVSQLALDAVFAAMNWVPETEKVREVLVSREFTAQMVLVVKNGMTRQAVFEAAWKEVRVEVEREVKVQKGAFEALEPMYEAISCALTQGGAVASEGFSPDDLVDKGLKIGTECADQAFENLKGLAKEVKAVAIGLIAAIPSTAKVLRETLQATVRGFESWGGQFTMKLTAPGPIVNDLAAALPQPGSALSPPPQSSVQAWRLEGSPNSFSKPNGSWHQQFSTSGLTTVVVGSGGECDLAPIPWIQPGATAAQGDYGVVVPGVANNAGLDSLLQAVIFPVAPGKNDAARTDIANEGSCRASSAWGYDEDVTGHQQAGDIVTTDWIWTPATSPDGSPILGSEAVSGQYVLTVYYRHRAGGGFGVLDQDAFLAFRTAAANAADHTLGTHFSQLW